METMTSSRQQGENATQATQGYAEVLIDSSCDKAEVGDKPVDLLYADPAEGLRVHRKTCEGGFKGKPHGYVDTVEETGIVGRGSPSPGTPNITDEGGGS